VTDEAWTAGMRDLVAMLPDASPTDEAVKEHRSRLYRQHLDHLADEAWLFAVAEAIRLERWFPTVAALWEYGRDFQPQYPALPRARRDEERELGRADAVRGVDLCRAAFERATGEKAPPLATFPRVELTAERREELKRSLLEGER